MALELIAGLLLVQGAPVVTVQGHADGQPGAEWVDVGYRELAAARPEEAIARIRDSRELEFGDPAALINLGSAHARLGRRDKAERYYKAAIISDTRYDLQLADGRWMDSRQAARLAIRQLKHGEDLALR